MGLRRRRSSSNNERVPINGNERTDSTRTAFLPAHPDSLRNDLVCAQEFDNSSSWQRPAVFRGIYLYAAVCCFFSPDLFLFSSPPLLSRSISLECARGLFDSPPKSFPSFLTVGLHAVHSFYSILTMSVQFDRAQSRRFQFPWINFACDFLASCTLCQSRNAIAITIVAKSERQTSNRFMFSRRRSSHPPP